MSSEYVGVLRRSIEGQGEANKEDSGGVEVRVTAFLVHRLTPIERQNGENL